MISLIGRTVFRVVGLIRGGPRRADEKRRPSPVETDSRFLIFSSFNVSRTSTGVTTQSESRLHHCPGPLFETTSDGLTTVLHPVPPTSPRLHGRKVTGDRETTPLGRRASFVYTTPRRHDRCMHSGTRRSVSSVRRRGSTETQVSDNLVEGYGQKNKNRNK